ncbi:NAD(P)H-binding protein [Porticoccus sp.]|uniref:NAD(P)H-binding protein n=1 Tax=Porticoccus sp. TaxID=2024853 RepID=UPI003F694F79
MKVLFIGCGDIGVRAIRRLQMLQGWAGLAMRRHPDRLPAAIPSVTGDICDTPELTELLRNAGVDAIVVTLTPGEMSDEGYRASYVAGAGSLARAIKDSGWCSGPVLWVSSTGVYGQDGGEWVDELSDTAPASYRCKRLLQAEGLIIRLTVPTVIVRYSGIYGPGRGRMLTQIKRGELAPPQPVQWSNRIHAEDCAGVLVHLLQCYRTDQPLHKLYLATDSDPTPLHEVHHWLAGQMGVSLSNSVTTTSVGRTGNRRCSNRRLLESGYQFLYPTFREGYPALISESPE